MIYLTLQSRSKSLVVNRSQWFVDHQVLFCSKKLSQSKKAETQEEAKKTAWVYLNSQIWQCQNWSKIPISFFWFCSYFYSILYKISMRIQLSMRIFVRSSQLNWTEVITNLQTLTRTVPARVRSHSIKWVHSFLSINCSRFSMPINNYK